MNPIIYNIKRLQERAGSKIDPPWWLSPSKPTVGFAFSSKDRFDQTARAITALDSDGPFQLVWNDDSTSALARDLPYSMKLKNIDIVEVNCVGGGALAAVGFGLRRLLALGYDYCGLIENDVVVQPGWLNTLMGLFDRAAQDGIVAGAASIRNYRSRVMEYRQGYTLNWAMGAGMVLFSRPAAQVIYNRLFRLSGDMTSLDVDFFYRREFGIDVGRVQVDGSGVRVGQGIGFSGDWSYAPVLYRFGYASVGSIPSMAPDLGLYGHGLWLLDDYVTAEDDSKGIAVAEFIGATA